MKLVNFHLSANWNQDLLREIIGELENGELKDLVEEMIPFTHEHSFNLTSTILNDDDLKEAGLWHE